nr:hypothetical protein [Kibdelosporangium sp. MJ126-NF4]
MWRDQRRILHRLGTAAHDHDFVHGEVGHHLTGLEHPSTGQDLTGVGPELVRLRCLAQVPVRGIAGGVERVERVRQRPLDGVVEVAEHARRDSRAPDAGLPQLVVRVCDRST